MDQKLMFHQSLLPQSTSEKLIVNKSDTTINFLDLRDLVETSIIFTNELTHRIACNSSKSSESETL